MRKGGSNFNIVALARRKIFVGHVGSREDTYLSHDSVSKLSLTLSARDAYIYIIMHKSPLPFPAGCIYAHLTYFTFACLPNYFAYCRGFCCSHQLLRASHFTH